MNCKECQHYIELKTPELHDDYGIYGHCLKKPGFRYPVYIPDGSCKDAKEIPDKYVGYHFTPRKNIPAIMKNGLIPKIGKRSQAANEKEPAIFLFRTLNDAYEGGMNWLLECFDENEDIAMLRVYFDRYEVPTPWEVIVKENISVDLINVVYTKC